MNVECGMRNAELRNIWTWVHHREGTIEDTTFGLIGEARRLIHELGGKGTITAVALGSGLKAELEKLGNYGAHKVLYVESEYLSHYHGELFVKIVTTLVRRRGEACILMAQTPETADLCPRLAAALETGLVMRAMDFKTNDNGDALAIRPVANGHLSEEIQVACRTSPIICFLPSVLSAPEPDTQGEVEIQTEPMDVALDDLKTKIVKIVTARPEDLDLEEADIIVSGGQGVGKGEAFNIIHELARTIGGTVGGTRPVIDRQMLPFERQIGQTGKTVAPRLMFACGISGANEFTAGMEKSQRVIGINTDPRARIFRFADLGIIGDVHNVLPLVISRLKEARDSEARD